MKSVTKFDIAGLVSMVADVERAMASHRWLLDTANSDIINLTTHAVRGEMIERLTAVISALPVMMTHIESIHARAIETQSAEIRAAETLKPVVISPVLPVMPPRFRSAGLATLHKNNIATGPTMVMVSAKCGLMARVVDHFRDVRNPGELYFVPNANHFAIIIAGMMYHGNIGTVYSDEKNPEKIRECKFASSCTKINTCNFYHDPTKFHQSRDVRNFVANSFMYTSGSHRNRGRRFGSLPNLDVDFPQISQDDVGRFSDQVMHDLLSSLILRAGGSSCNRGQA